MQRAPRARRRSSVRPACGTRGRRSSLIGRDYTEHLGSEEGGMIPRRNLVTGGLVGSVLGALGGGDEVDAAPAAAAGADVTDDMVTRIVGAIAGLKTEIQSLKSFPEIAPVR